MSTIRLIKPFEESDSIFMADLDNKQFWTNTDSAGLFLDQSKYTIRLFVMADLENRKAKIPCFPPEIDGNGRRATWLHLACINELVARYCYKQKSISHEEVKQSLEERLQIFNLSQYLHVECLPIATLVFNEQIIVANNNNLIKNTEVTVDEEKILRDPSFLAYSRAALGNVVKACNATAYHLSESELQQIERDLEERNNLEENKSSAIRLLSGLARWGTFSNKINSVGWKKKKTALENLSGEEDSELSSSKESDENGSSEDEDGSSEDEDGSSEDEDELLARDEMDTEPSSLDDFQ